MTTLRQMGEAQRRNDLAEFERLARAYPENLYNDHGWEHWLAGSARDGQLPFVQLLVSLGVGVNAPSGSAPTTPPSSGPRARAA